MLGERVIPAAVLLPLLAVVVLIGEAKADIYVCKGSQGIVQFTNIPSQSGCQTVIREWGRGAARSFQSPEHFDGIIRSASERYGVDPDLIRAVIKVESDFNSGARSHKGAQGLMQLMPETARLHNVSDVYDPHENIDGGVRHLRLLLDHFRGDLELTLAAYNAGAKAVEKHRGIPPFAETREYVRRVLGLYRRYGNNGTVSITEKTKP